jgi:hypothetical protein
LNQNPSYDYAGEVNALAAAVGNPSLAQASGIKAGGVKYMFIRSHVQDQSADPFLAGNKGGAGISVRQTKAVILVAISAPGAAGALLVSVSVSLVFSCANHLSSSPDVSSLLSFCLFCAPCRPSHVRLVSPMRHSAVQGRPVADRRQLLKFPIRRVLPLSPRGASTPLFLLDQWHLRFICKHFVCRVYERLARKILIT